VAYTSGSDWLSFAQPASSTVPSGCVQTLAETVTGTGPASEGLYKATVTWTYNPGGKIVTMPVELYNFTNWFMDENNSIRTATVAMAVNQSSRIGSSRAGYPGFRYFDDPATVSYLFDGSLLIGTSNANISTSLHAADAGVRGNGDTAIGRMFGLSAMTFDSTTIGSYRIGTGVGCNRDSSIAFDAAFYAPKHIDSANFMIGKFSLYAGPKNSAATINNVTVCYSSDIDIPDDSSRNLGGVDTDRQMVYQKGVWPASATRFGALSGWREDATPLVGGMVLDNRNWLYPHNGYENDSIWTRIQATTGYDPYPRPTHLAQDTAKDLNSMLVFSKTATITPKGSGVFTIYVIFAGQPKAGGSLDGLKATIAKAKKFMCTHLGVNEVLCIVACSDCGDANGDGGIDISDAVFLIAYIFSGGGAPGECNYANGKGDANGDGGVDISDAVYLIAYIFSGGGTPHCQPK
jgi:hypothetical protein